MNTADLELVRASPRRDPRECALRSRALAAKERVFEQAAGIIGWSLRRNATVESISNRLEKIIYVK